MHKYLKDINVQAMSDMMQNDPRQDKWKEQFNEYGFDERDTWDLRHAFMCWLYERLKMYNEINIIATDKETITINNETQTFQTWIDRLILGCEYYFKLSDSIVNEKIKYIITHEVLDLFNKLIDFLWW